MVPDLQWSRGSRRLVIGSHPVDLPGQISRVLHWEEKRVVLAIVDAPEFLLALDWTGRLVHTFSPPEGFHFYYLDNHPRFGVVVICSSDAPVENWNDWQFRINLEHKTLERFSPSK